MQEMDVGYRFFHVLDDCLAKLNFGKNESHGLLRLFPF